MSEAFTPCVDCGEEPGSSPDGRCRDCDINRLLGVCWCCGHQWDPIEWNADGWRAIFGTDPPPPRESEEHAPDCARRKALAQWSNWQSHGPPPSDPPTHTCDWGGCNAVATAVRFSPGQGWLSVCGECAKKKTEERR